MDYVIITEHAVPEIAKAYMEYYTFGMYAAANLKVMGKYFLA